MFFKYIASGVLAAAIAACAVIAQATVTVDMVTVGNPGNAGQWIGPSYGGVGDPGTDRLTGEVDYNYQIGKFEITAGQYTEFLNAVAVTDAYGLYNTDMGTVGWGNVMIMRSGDEGNYSYSVAADYANRPTCYVSWGDAAHFCNWLTNGQPTGAQTDLTTEDGSYDMNGAIEITDLNAVVRKTYADGTRYVIPTEDEWYKAAFHKNDGVTGNYWDYATGSDTAPSKLLVDPDPGNNASYSPGSGTTAGSTLGGAPYYKTEVGRF